ncbi:competence protein CoiA, partial [Alkalihalophilus lindianensis]|nr:competence protein CoiA [Alkalihalophilus lindianensis]
DQFKLNWSLNPGAHSNRFLHELYNQNMNLFLLPAEIGLPVPHSLFFQTSTIVWQTYLFLDVLADKNPGDMVTLNEIRSQNKRRIKRKELSIRRMPQLEKVNDMVPVND